jgi:hypothetical protein
MNTKVRQRTRLINRYMNSGRKYITLKRKQLRIWKTSEKRTKQNAKQNGRPIQQNRTSRTQISELEDEW